MRLYHLPWSDLILRCKIIFSFPAVASTKSHWKQWQGSYWFQMYWVSPKLSSLLSVQGNTRNVLWFSWSHSNCLSGVGLGRICVYSLCNFQIHIPLVVLYFSWTDWRCFSCIFLASVQSVNLFENQVGTTQIKHNYTSCLWWESTLKELLSFLVTKKCNMSIWKRQARDEDIRWNACV